MNALLPLILVLVLAGVAYAGGEIRGARWLMGVVLPYGALVIFLAGLIYRVVRWARTPVPFHVPTTCGQQKSLPWIQSSLVDNPHNRTGVLLRMASEVFLFRSLFRNTKSELREGPRLIYGEEKFLWLAGLAFHWSLLFILLRHLRFFVVPVPAFVLKLEALDGFLQIGAPEYLMTDFVILAALVFLLVRRFLNPQVRTISLFTDYFALFLLFGVAVSGILMRYFTRIDLESAKQLAAGLAAFTPVIPDRVGAFFFVHLALVSVLFAYFPFSKLVHMGGIFLSPTRNLPNDSRMRRHVNPWDYPVKVHTYEEWEAEFHDKLKTAGLPLERQ